MPDKTKLSHIERRVYVSPNTNPGDSVRYGDWSETPAYRTWYDGESTRENLLGRYMADGVPLTIIEATCSSDYSGSLYEMSNYRVMKRDYPWLVEIYGSHGTQALGYLGRRETQNPALIEAIDSLADYPCLDESDESDLEMESVWKAWLDYGRRKFAEEITPVLDALDPDHEHDVREHDDTCTFSAPEGSQSELDEIWHKGCDAYNVNGGSGYVNEQGDSIHFYITEWITSAMRSEDSRYPWSEWSRKAREEMQSKLQALAVASRIEA